MIPLRLRIKGLYSYREQVEINFERLAEANLFGIFGPVGSGKSALLEAITYALYGNTERLNSSGDNRNYNMMNLQSQELLIEYEFKTATTEAETRYLFRVNQKRNSKQFSDVRSPNRSALTWKNGEWQALESTDAEKVLKLSYENFVKTIIIPQGKFQDFLHMTPTLRTRMLRELFSLDRFELDQPAKALIGTTNVQLVRLEEQLLVLAEANPAEIEAKSGMLVELGAVLEKEKAHFLQLEAAVTLHRQLKKIEEERQLIREKLAHLYAKKEEYAGREARANHYQRVVFEFRELTNQIVKLQRELSLAETTFSQSSSALAELLPRLDTARQAAQKAKSEWEAKDRIALQLKDCEHLQEVQVADEKLAVIEGRLKNGNEAVQQVVRQIQDNEAARLHCEAVIAEDRKRMPDLARVMAAQNWYQQRYTLQLQVDGVSERLGQTQAELDRLLTEQQKLVADRNLSISGGMNVLQALLHTVSATKADIAAARTEKEQMAHQGALATFALELASGKPCPLCGADHHPHPYDSGEAQAQLQATDQKLQTLEAQLAAAEKAFSAAQHLAIRIEEKQKQFQQQQADHGRNQEQLAALLQAFHWKEYAPDSPGQAEADRAAALELQKTIDQEEAKRAELERNWKKLQEDQKRFEVALNGLREDKNRLMGQRDTHLKQRVVLTGPEYLEKKEDELRLLTQDLQTQLDHILRTFQTTQEAEKTLEMKEVELRQRQIAAEADRKRVEAELTAVNKAVSGKLVAAGYADLEEIKAILAWNLDLETEQAAISHYKGQVQSAEVALSYLEAQAGSKHYDATAHDACETALVGSRAAVEAHQETISLLKSALDKLRADLERRRDLERQQSAQKSRLENLKVLEGLFKASGFVKYVSTIYLQELVSRADVRFRTLTRNALSLELDDENDFLVRDMLNGGKTRSVKTLSGGQTFQASLCLALALADNVQQHSGSHHNFFFLDEGFGTLDKDSLSVVFDTLKQLRQENRIVGVISHVEEMQQEIEVFLRVYQTEEKGSQVVGSWE